MIILMRSLHSDYNIPTLFSFNTISSQMSEIVCEMERRLLPNLWLRLQLQIGGRGIAWLHGDREASKKAARGRKDLQVG